MMAMAMTGAQAEERGLRALQIPARTARQEKVRHIPRYRCCVGIDMMHYCVFPLSVCPASTEFVRVVIRLIYIYLCIFMYLFFYIYVFVLFSLFNYFLLIYFDINESSRYIRNKKN